MSHTGAKTQLGGLSAGLARSAYQVGIAVAVNTDPTTPANSETPTAIISFKKDGNRTLFSKQILQNQQDLNLLQLHN
jgi:hypothetical protein